MPLAFMDTPAAAKPVLLNKEEKNVASFIRDVDSYTMQKGGKYFTTVHMNVKFSRSKASDAIAVQLSNDPSSMKIQFSEDQLKEKYPLTYEVLNSECRERYSNFKINAEYHQIRKALKANPKYCTVRYLDPDNPKSLKQERYSRAIFTELDRHYKKNG